MQQPANEVVFEGIHCTLTIRRPRPGVVLAVFKGPDVGEFGQAPFQELAKDLNTGKQIEIFVDARAVPQASLDVSSDWAQWMITNDKSLIRINMLCATPFVQLTARIVRNLTTFGNGCGFIRRPVRSNRRWARRSWESRLDPKGGRWRR